MTNRTFTVSTAHTDALRSIDLREEAAAYREEYGDDAQAAIIRIDGEGNAAEALFLPGYGRVGIAWGAYADWADYDDLDDAIRDYLNDPEMFASNN